jgi:hypothetical protein
VVAVGLGAGESALRHFVTFRILLTGNREHLRVGGSRRSHPRDNSQEGL